MSTTTSTTAQAEPTSLATVSPLPLYAMHVRMLVIETLRVPIAVIGSMAFPALSLLFFVVPNRGVADDPVFATQAVVSLSVFAVMVSALFNLGLTVAENREKPWDPYLRSLPLPAAVRISAQLTATAMLSFLSLVPVLIVGALATEATVSVLGLIAGLAVLALTSIPFLLLGAAIGYAFSSKAAIAVIQVGMFGFAFGGGLFFPPQFFPRTGDGQGHARAEYIDEQGATVRSEACARELRQSRLPETVDSAFGRDADEVLRTAAIFADDEVTPGSQRDVVTVLHQVAVVGFKEQFELSRVIPLLRSSLHDARNVAPDLSLSLRATIGASEIDPVLSVPNALATRERQRTEIQILRTPPQHGRVEGDDDGLRADRLGPVQQAVDEVLVRAPVQLEPARCVAHRGGAVLHRRAALVGEDVRHPRGRGGPRDRQVAVGGHQRARTDRCEQQRRRQRGVHHRGAEVAFGDAVRHARHDRPPVERAPVVAHRAALTGTSRDVRPGTLRTGPARGTFEIGEVRRDRGTAAQRAVAVDDPLTFPAGTCGGGGGDFGHGFSSRRARTSTTVTATRGRDHRCEPRSARRGRRPRCGG